MLGGSSQWLGQFTPVCELVRRLVHRIYKWMITLLLPLIKNQGYTYVYIYIYKTTYAIYIYISLSIYILHTYNIIYLGSVGYFTSNFTNIFPPRSADMAEIPYQETRDAGYFWQKSEMALAASCLDFFEIWRYHGGIRIGIYIYI